jgi:hypothetical protein
MQIHHTFSTFLIWPELGGFTEEPSKRVPIKLVILERVTCNQADSAITRAVESNRRSSLSCWQGLVPPVLLQSVGGLQLVEDAVQG